MRYFRPIVLVLLLLAVNASAQTTSGSISGSVVDAQNQVVPGADIIVTNQQTQEVRRTVSNEVGLFAFPALQPGPYSIAPSSPASGRSNVATTSCRRTTASRCRRCDSKSDRSPRR